MHSACPVENIKAPHRPGYLVCGMSFRLSPVELREKTAIPSDLLPDALHHLKRQPGIRECMILSTCNRTELYLSAESWLDGKNILLDLVQAARGFDLTPFADQIYLFRDADAVAHSFRVASSLDSLVLGEPQILGQTKAAFREAEKNGCIDRFLHRWIPRAFAAAKQVRNETGICEEPVSVSYAAIQLAKKLHGSLVGKAVVLLGAGKMGELAALHLKEAGASSIVVINRTYSRAHSLARRFAGEAVEFRHRASRISGADIVICSTEAPSYVIRAEDCRAMLSRRPRRPLLLLDISVPRAVDPRVGELDGAHLFNIDDLEQAVKSNRRRRRAKALGAEQILQKSLDRFMKEESGAHATPTIAAIRNQVRAICQTELERLGQKLPQMTGEQREAMELMLHRIAQKIVHPAIMELKAMDSGKQAAAKRALIERLFGVERETSSD